MTSRTGGAGYLKRQANERAELDRDRRGGRRTSLKAEDFERVLTCTRCREQVRVFEAAHGARTKREHQHLDPRSYVCGDCMKPKGASS